ncbi:MAG TPA: catalase, partial [Nannocystis sp.]
YGVNTYRLIDAKDRARLVKFHWKPKLGAHSMTWDEARKLGGIDPDYHRRDLWDAIERKDYPEFELAIQVIEEEDQDKFPFDPLDATKVWPLQLVPLEPIGKLVLNRNPDNYFAETEQVAFNPAHLVPGIDFSDDPLLQGRLISYLDAQIHRLGSPNFDELAINRPKGEIDSNRREGQMRQRIDKGRAAYSPNSLAKGCPMHAGAKGYGTHPATETGTKTRARGEKFGDHFGQAQLFWRSQSEIEQRHIVEAFVYELSMVDVVDVRRRAVDLLAQVDAKLAGRVADGLGLKIDDAKAAMKRLEADWKKFGVTAPPGPRRDYDQIKAPELSLEKTAKDTIRTRKIAVLVADGVEGNQVEAMRSALTAEGAYVEVVAPTLAVIKRADGKTIAPDNSLLTASSVMYDAIYVPGGPKSVATLKQQGRAIHFINEAYSHYKTIAATDEGIDLLLASGIGAKDEAELLKTAGVVGSRKAGDTKKVAKEFASAIAAHRHWEREVERVPA